MLSDILKIYQKNDVFLILNSLFPSWITTNRTGLAVIKLYLEIKDNLRKEVGKRGLSSKKEKITALRITRSLTNENQKKAVEKKLSSIDTIKENKPLAEISPKNVTGKLSVLSEEKIIKIISEQIPSLSEKSISAFLSYATNENLFCDAPSLKIHKPYFLSALYLNMTEKCNLHCTYCYAGTRTEKGKNYLTVDDYRRVLEESKSLTNNGSLDVIFTGGEPLVSENTIPVAKVCKEMGYTTRILTNGTLINEDNISVLTDVFDFFKISLDGSNAEKHDFYRGYGSYEKTIHAINLLKECNAKIMLAMVVTAENKDDVKAMHKKWGNIMSYQPLFPMGRAKDDNSLTGEQYYEALSVEAGLVPFSNIQNIIQGHKRNKCIHKCAIGDGEISISCTGDVYPCQLLHYDDFYLGNIRNASLSDIYHSEKNGKFKMHTAENIDKCSSCDFIYLCGGACQARHYCETGSIDKAGDFCKYEKLGIINGLIETSRMVTV